MYCFRSIWVGYSVRDGLFYLYFPVRECDRVWCLACEYCRASCVGCISGSGGDVAIGYLVWGFSFRCDLVVLHFFWVRDLIWIGICDPSILSIRQQTGKGSEIISDIFKTLIFTVWTKCVVILCFALVNCFKHLIVTICKVFLQLWKSWWAEFAS